jgi:hypothetical protein
MLVDSSEAVDGADDIVDLAIRGVGLPGLEPGTSSLSELPSDDGGAT